MMMMGIPSMKEEQEQQNQIEYAVHLTLFDQQLHLAGNHDQMMSLLGHQPVVEGFFGLCIGPVNTPEMYNKCCWRINLSGIELLPSCFLLIINKGTNEYPISCWSGFLGCFKLSCGRT